MQVAEMLERRIRDLDKKIDRNNKELNDKLDSLLVFKWQVVGGSLVVTALVTLGFQVAIAIYS